MNVTIEYHCRILAVINESNRNIAEVYLEYGPEFKSRLCLGWVSDDNSCPSNGLGRDALPETLVDQVRQNLTEPIVDSTLRPTRFEHILSSET